MKRICGCLALLLCFTLHAQREYLIDDFAGYDCGVQYKDAAPLAGERVYTVQQALESKSSRVVLSLRDAGMARLDSVIPKLHLIRNLYALIIYTPTSNTPAYRCYSEAILLHNLQVLNREIPLLVNLRYLSVCYPDSTLLSEITKLNNLQGLLIIVNHDPIPNSISNLKNLETLYLLNNDCSFLDSVITLPKLRELYINVRGNCNLSNLSSLNKVEDLTLMGSTKELPFLDTLTRLKKLHLVHNLHPNCVIPKSVEELLVNGPFSDSDIRITAPSRLRVVSIQNRSRFDSLPDWLWQSTNVERLWVDGLQVSILSKATYKFKRLRFLVTYSYDDLTNENTKCLSEFKRLTFLAIIGNQNYTSPPTQFRRTEQLQKCRNLKTLYLYNVALADSCGAENLRCEELHITDAALNASANEIAKMKKLTKITILRWHYSDTRASEEIIRKELPKVQISSKMLPSYFSDLGQMFYFQ